MPPFRNWTLPHPDFPQRRTEFFNRLLIELSAIAAPATNKNNAHPVSGVGVGRIACESYVAIAKLGDFSACLNAEGASGVGGPAGASGFGSFDRMASRNCFAISSRGSIFTALSS